MEVTVETQINAPIDTVWSAWTSPEDITNWNFTSNDWCCPKATIELKVGGQLNFRMEAKDGTMGFDLIGTFCTIDNHKLIEYTLEDNRKVSIRFEASNGGTKVTETFDAETQNSVEMQKHGWQCILDNFKSHVESK